MGLFQLENRIDYYFQEISNIPRGSDNERGIRDYIERFVVSHGLSGAFDEENNNFIVYKEASKGYENHEPVMLQGHLDMVCEKNNDSQHDFLKDPIELIEEDGFLHANKTTLGADDGVAICYMLAILEDQTLKHPPLECVFTAQEEVGLKGAMALNKSHIHAKRMIGLDSGNEKVVTISCSGGRRMMVEKELHYIKNNLPCYQITIGGLKGGHSGDLIHLERGNANKLMSRLYYQFLLNDIDFALGSLQGGLKDNAIPRECVSVFASHSDEQKIKDIVEKVEQEIKAELQESDVGLSIQFNQTTALDQTLSLQESQDIIKMMYLLPNGFQHKSLDMDLTNVSLNMGVVNMEQDLYILYSIRSPFESAKDELSHQIALLAELFKGKTYIENNYPGWNYDPHSTLRKQYIDFVRESEGIELIEEGTHGGLETGIFKGAIPDLDIVTMGPNMYDIHTPDERLDLASYHHCYQRLIHFLERL